MLEWLSLSSLVDKGWKVAAFFAGGCALALFLPGPDALRNFVDQNRGFWWVLFLFALAALGVFILARLLEAAAGKLGERNDRARRRQEAKETFDGLSPEERTLLRDFARQKRRSLQLPSRDPVVRGLASRTILLGGAGLVSEIVDVTEYRIRDDDLWNYLLAHEEASGDGAERSAPN